ncbi:MAG TPA: hypothetical protein GX707_01115 [Epulopiscium sp.]|nr:hypothetical protein [Candidatus Epulonipiscium sp.]
MNEKKRSVESFNDSKQLAEAINTDKNTELLNLFATYVYMTNQDYKYNETYLRDMIPGFWGNIQKYHAKVLFCEYLLSEVEKMVMPRAVKYRLTIIIDETWELRFKNIPEEKKSKWEKVISAIPKLNAIDKKKIYVQCRFCDSEDVIFSDYLMSGDQEQLVQFVKGSIEIFIRKMGEQCSD